MKFGFLEFEDVNRKLEELSLSKKYVFHGSSRENNILKPQKANDKVKESGNRKAIYLTNSPVLAIFCALAGGIEGMRERRNSINEIHSERGIEYQDIKLLVSHPELIKDEGYVYVCKRNGLDYENGEFLSYEPLKPEMVIKVKRSDLKYNIEKI